MWKETEECNAHPASAASEMRLHPTVSRPFWDEMKRMHLVRWKTHKLCSLWLFPRTLLVISLLRFLSWERTQRHRSAVESVRRQSAPLKYLISKDFSLRYHFSYLIILLYLAVPVIKLMFKVENWKLYDFLLYSIEKFQGELTQIFNLI